MCRPVLIEPQSTVMVCLRLTLKKTNNQLISRNAKKQAKAYKCDTRQENEA